MRSARLADALGLLLVAAAAGAAVASMVVNGGGEATAVVAMLAAAGVAHAAGRVLGPVVGVVAALVVGAIVLLVVLEPGSLSGYPLAPPLGYANANAALYVQATALAGAAAITLTVREWRQAAFVVAAGLVLITAVTGSLAGLIAGAAVLGAIRLAQVPFDVSSRAVATTSVVLVLAAHLLVFVLGAGYRPGSLETSPFQSAAEASLSSRRLALWHDAVQIALRNPLTGIGVGRYSVEGPTAQLDLDTREAHSAVLEWAAETGWFGAAAVLGLLLWLAVRPLIGATTGLTPPGALVASVAATGFGLHTTVDYVASFPFVVVLVAFVSGSGTALASLEDRASSRTGLIG